MPYTYRIENTITKNFYMGSRLVKSEPEKDLWVKYFTSSKYVKKLIKEHGKESFIIDILSHHDDRIECFRKEQELIKYWIHDPLCLNKHYFEGHQKVFLTGKISDETRKKMANAVRPPPWNVGKIAHNKGVPASESQREKNRIARQKQKSKPGARKVSIDDILYETIIDAAKQLNIPWSGIDHRCRSQKYPNWYKL